MSAADKAALLEHFADEHSPWVKLAKDHGPEYVDALLAEMGGQKPHIPRHHSFWGGLQREVRNERIRARFRGNNWAELEDEFGLGERELRNIVNGKPRRPQKPQDTRPVQVSTQSAAIVQELAERHGTSVRAITDALIAVAVDTPAIRQELATRFGTQTQLQVVNG